MKTLILAVCLLIAPAVYGIDLFPSGGDDTAQIQAAVNTSPGPVHLVATGVAFRILGQVQISRVQIRIYGDPTSVDSVNGKPFIIMPISGIIRIDNLSIHGANTAVVIHGGTNIRLENLVIGQCQTWNGVGILIEGGYDIIIRGCLIQGVTSGIPPADGVLVTGCGDVRINECQIIGFAYGLEASAAPGVILDCINASDCIFDTNLSGGVYYHTDGGTIRWSSLTDCRMSNTQNGYGLIFAAVGGGQITGVSVNGCHIVSNHVFGVSYGGQVYNSTPEAVIIQ